MKSSHAPDPNIRTLGRRNAKRLFLTCLVVIATCGLSNVTMSSSLLGPFIPGSGNLSIISGAAFDSESQVLEWMGSGKYPGMIGHFLLSSERAFRGSGSIHSSNVCSKITPAVFLLRKSVNVEIGQPYVLSAFFYTERTKGRVFIDVEDRTGSFDYGRGADVAEARNGIPQWQFAWTTITPTNSPIILRVGFEQSDFMDDTAFVDDVALTPTSQFQPPVPIESASPSLGVQLVPLITINGTVGRPYLIEVTANLTSTSWEPLTNIFLPASPFVFADLSAPHASTRFYRARSLPED